MSKQNPFDGNGSYPEFARIAYKQLMTRQWITYKSIMAEKNKKDISDGVTNYDLYGELKKAFPHIRKAICEKLGSDAVVEKGNNRNKEYLYTGKEDDPLADMRKAKAIKDLGIYWDFCQNSAGFFPLAWLEDFFRDSIDLLEIKQKKQKGEQIINASLDRILTNIDLLPLLYKAIKMKQVLYIDYKPYDKESYTLTFHPHILKEYNGRWHLFGHAEGNEPEYGYDIALDRIQGKPIRNPQKQKDYKTAPAGFYENFFKDIVGVSHIEGTSPVDVHIRAHIHSIFKLTETKPIHQSQKTTIPFSKHEDGEYGEFAVHVEVNNEFIGKILQMGDGLEIVSPADIREVFRKRINEMANRYD